MDGQFTGFITEGRKKFIYMSTERTGPGFSAFKALADRPAQKNATSYPVSQSRVLPTNHEAGHVFSPTSKVGRAFFRTHVYSDSSPRFAKPGLVVGSGVLWTVKLLVSITQRTRILTSSPVSQSRVLPNKSRTGHVF